MSQSIFNRHQEMLDEAAAMRRDGCSSMPQIRMITEETKEDIGGISQLQFIAAAPFALQT